MWRQRHRRTRSAQLPQHSAHGYSTPRLSRGFILILAAAAAFAQGSDYDQGVALFEHGDLAGAVPLLARAAKAHPGDAQMWKALGVAYAAQKLYREAEEPLRKACEIDP